MKWKKIKIEDIIDDGISTREVDSDLYHKLESSVQKYGQLKNLIVKKKDDKYILVDGTIIFKILKKYEDEVVCVIIDDETDEYLLNLEINFTLRNDLVKIAKRFRQLLEKGIRKQDISISTLYYENEIEFYSNFLDYDFKKYDLNLHNKLYSEGNEEYF